MAKVTIAGRSYNVSKRGVSRNSKSGRSTQAVIGREARRARAKASGGSGG